jgi:hypothetical protein
MSSGKEKEFDSYARDCMQLADQADTSELREAMINMAREWMQAVMDEEDVKRIQPSRCPAVKSNGGAEAA